MWQDLMLPSGNNDIIIPINIVGDSRGEEVVHTSTSLWSSTLFSTQSLYITHRQSDRNFILFEQRSYLLFGPGPMRSAGCWRWRLEDDFYDSSECLAFFILSSLLVGKELTKPYWRTQKKSFENGTFFTLWLQQLLLKDHNFTVRQPNGKMQFESGIQAKAGSGQTSTWQRAPIRWIPNKTQTQVSSRRGGDYYYTATHLCRFLLFLFLLLCDLEVWDKGFSCTDGKSVSFWLSPVSASDLEEGFSTMFNDSFGSSV